MRQRLFLVLLPVLLLSLSLPGCQAAGISGTVFVDANDSGALDPGEQALAGVPVSDGREVVVTDAQGQYLLKAAPSPALVRLTVPTGYWPRGDQWFQRVATAGPPVDFPLQERPYRTPWRFVQVSDVHYIVPAQPLVRRFVEEVAALDPPPALVISTGDLVNDAGGVTDGDLIRRLFAQYLAALSDLPAPLLNLAGNHDLPGYGGKLPLDDPLFGARGFEALVGPAWYSLDYAGHHLVMLLATRRDPDTGQVSEGVPEECLRWLEKDLAVTPRDRPLLLFSHQPPKSWQAAVAPLLAGRKILGVFCGHHHRNKVYPMGDWTVFEDGALSGGWWMGLGPENTPRGYRLVTVGPDGVTSEYKQAP